MTDHEEMTDHESERRVSQLLEELGAADPPPDFSRNIVWGIKNSRVTVHRARFVSNSVSNSKRYDMTRKAMWGLAAAASILLAIFVVRGVPPADEGTEATIGAAQRYQAPQIEAKDVLVGDTSAQAVMQSETWDRIVKDETLRTLLQNAGFRAQLQEAGLRAALADSAVVRALAQADLRTAMQNQAFADALRNDDFRAQLADPRVAAALAGAAFQNALRDRGFVAALGHPQFAPALARGAQCDDDFGCGTNSPVVDGARID